MARQTAQTKNNMLSDKFYIKNQYRTLRFIGLTPNIYQRAMLPSHTIHKPYND